MSGKAAFLFLQGPASPLFGKIADRLEAAGHACWRINLHAGDSLFWRRRGAIAYRGRAQAWGAFIRRVIEERAIGSLVLLGEERPYHAEAVRVARAAGVGVFVVEMGYLRPDWVTVERDGMSSNSHFPNEPEAILAAAGNLPEPDRTRLYGHSFLAEALYDLAYNLPSVFLAFLYPHYRRHGLFHPLAEYAGWIVQLATRGRRDARALATVAGLKAGGAPWFVYPLQLQTDFQLRAHSPYNSQQQAIAAVLTSFAAHAPACAQLAIKVHPLDNGLISWKRVIAQKAQRLGIAGRVHYVGGGDLGSLLEGCSGIVTVNSTAALHGLRDGIPAKVLGTAIYDIPGMTEQRPLDAFWTAPHRPDPVLTSAFYRLLAASIQVRGDFYSDAGTTAAAEAIAGRLLSGTVNQPGGDSGCVPRRKPAKYPPALFID
ncbi:capsular biosynthesis protein [Rhizobiaceae bacterium BDR2-2]|uniref:Capsular biosynthesis protein n=1 Tax=Ectorhizobium quercum TaxID=2965071 RepID=A0AAE3MVY2_9HYPH|nr:capsular biosynthesis protein [Ectorhizobium quercum]MCX8996213.1 capsular biosynthesis protein [Ectorhizobium quercum]MCX8998748.1 capsular biosynthesis protein [Ectorhizobium quercum]